MKKIVEKAKKNLSDDGFTLVELMVVIVIIAILASVALPAFQAILDDSKDSAAVAEARSIYMVTEVYYNRISLGRSNATYPSRSSLLEQAGVDPAKKDSKYAVSIGLDPIDNKTKITVNVLSDTGNIIKIVAGELDITYVEGSFKAFWWLGYAGENA